jgi:replicative DNA helicase
MAETDEYNTEIDGPPEGEDLPGEDTASRTSDAPYDPASLTQATLISYLLAYPDVHVIAAPILKAEYFEPEFRSVIAFIAEYTAEYKVLPTLAMIQMHTNMALPKVEAPPDPRYEKWLRDEIETFCRHQAMRIEVVAAAKLIAKDKSRATSESIMKKFRSISEISIETDLGIEVHEDMQRILAERDMDVKISSGYRHLDLVTQGGLPRPGVIMIAGRQGRGKSVVLGNFAINSAMRGLNVMYVSLELSERRMMRRFASQMSGIPTFEVLKRQDQVVITVQDRVLNNNEAGIFVKRMPMSGTTVAHLYSYWKEILTRRGAKCDVLCLDYQDLMSPVQRGVDLSDIHIRDKFVSEELYDFCVETNMITYTASQMTKQKEETEGVHGGMLAGGTPKLSTCDYLMFLRSTNRDDDHVSLYIEKGRDGGDGRTIPLHWDKNTLRVTDATDEKFYQANPSLDPNLVNKVMAKQSKGALVNMSREAISRKATEIAIRAEQTVSRASSIDPGPLDS